MWAVRKYAYSNKIEEKISKKSLPNGKKNFLIKVLLDGTFQHKVFGWQKGFTYLSKHVTIRWCFSCKLFLNVKSSHKIHIMRYFIGALSSILPNCNLRIFKKFKCASLQVSYTICSRTLPCMKIHRKWAVFILII